jgi:hypothetical protein
VPDDNGRPGQGGRDEVAENHSTPIVADQVTRAIVELLPPGDTVTFPELAARLEARGVEVAGQESLALAQDAAVILWTCWRPELVDAVVELVAAGRLVVERCAAERYRGLQVDLPLAPLQRPSELLPEPCWLPAVVWSPRRLRESAA